MWRFIIRMIKTWAPACRWFHSSLQQILTEQLPSTRYCGDTRKSLFLHNILLWAWRRMQNNRIFCVQPCMTPHFSEDKILPMAYKASHATPSFTSLTAPLTFLTLAHPSHLPPSYCALIVFLFPWSIWTRYVISWTYYFYCYSPSPYYKLHEGRAFFLSVLLTAITPASTTVHDPSILVKWTDIISTNPFKTYKRVPWDWLLGDTVVEYLKSQLYPCGTSNTQPLRCGGEDTSLNSR